MTRPARLLIVDDEVALLKALCDTLRDQGYETTGFASGRVALAALQSAKFDLLLADLMMPEMDGIALLQAALESDPELVGIIMTGEGTIATAVDAMKTGALDYILKPFKLSAILPVLSRGLAMRRLRLENAELTQRLREHAAELEAANKDLEAFSFSVSHDLRAPLRAMDTYCGIIEEELGDKLGESGRRMFKVVRDGTQRMGRLIEDLLVFARLGRQSLSKQPVSVSALVREVVDDLGKEQTQRKIEVRVRDLPDCLGDPALLKQVFVNLLSNAFKFTRQKEEALVEVGCDQRGGERTYFIRDNGVGFDMRRADRLFEAFHRLHGGREFEGTGVGLSIVHRVIRRHGGRVWAEAEVDRGATFYFTLPG
jgi:two-component system, sensor histidine kinase and response regulator